MDVKERYARIVELHETRQLNNSQIARELGISEITVRRYLAKWRSGIPIESVRCVGGQRKVNNEARQFITQSLARNPTASSKILARELMTKGVDVTRRCVSQNLADLGYRYSVPRIVPLLTDRHKALRVQWCRKFLEFDWEMVYFSDETYVELQGKPNCVWHKKGQRPIAPRPKYIAKTMFWGAISIESRSPLVPSTARMNSQGYCDIIRDMFIPFVTRTRTRRFFLQQDNAPAHVSKHTREFFDTNKVKTFEWPANSPDLNPIENIWSILKRNVSERTPANLTELSQVASEEWLKISTETIRKTILTMKKRILQVIERNGAKCDY